MAIETVKVPDLGGGDGVEVIEVSVSPGDTVEVEETLLVLESDKASMDVPSPVAGVIKKILVKLGDSVTEGTAIVDVEVEGNDAQPTPQAAPDEEDAPAPVTDETPDAAPAQPPAAAQAPVAEEQPLLLPDLGTGDDVDVIEITVAVGDQVGEGDPLMTLEGDKATMDVPSPVAGTILALSVSEGDKVKSGQQVGLIQVEATLQAGVETGQITSPSDAEDTAPPSETPVAPTAQGQDEDVAPPAPQTGEQTVDTPTLNEPEAPASAVYAGPVVRQFARELGIDLRNVQGSGVKGRVQKEDVTAYIKRVVQQSDSAQAPAGGVIAPIPDQDFSTFGEVEDVPLNKIAKLTAANMTRTWLNVPMVTQFDDADITEMEAFRHSLKKDAEKRGVKVTPVAFVMKACAAMLRENPVINRSWHSSGEKVIQKHYVHIGMAVATDKGLLVPVIRDVDKKGIFELSADIAEMAEKARTGKLSAADMQGGGFSISSLGAIGGRGFTPIVNAPEAAILGVSKASIQPVWNGESFEPRQLLPLSLSYDHKLVNGADAGKFLTDVVAALGDMRRLLL